MITLTCEMIWFWWKGCFQFEVECRFFFFFFFLNFSKVFICFFYFFFLPPPTLFTIQVYAVHILATLTSLYKIYHHEGTYCLTLLNKKVEEKKPVSINTTFISNVWVTLISESLQESSKRSWKTTDLTTSTTYLTMAGSYSIFVFQIQRSHL